MLIERIIRKLADRNDIGSLMPGTNNKRGRMVRAGGNQAQTRQPFHVGCIPKPSRRQSQLPKMNSFCNKLLRLSPLDGVPDALQVFSDLASQHFEVPSSEKARCGSQIPDVVRRGGF